VNDATDPRVLIAELVPGTRVASVVGLGAGLRARTFRCEVIAEGLSQSWVVKEFPQTSTHAQQEFNSYARLGKTVGIVPTMIALDPDRRVLILQFLTHSVDLFVALRRSSDAASVMRTLGALIARMIVATSDPPVVADDVAARESAALLAAWPKVAAWAGEFGVRRTPDLDRAIAAVTDCYANGKPASLTQGDPAPSNVAFTTDGQARLVDFEYGAQRHALADLAQWWIRCPLPEPWFEELVDIVRNELMAAGIYDNVDVFDDDLAHLATYAAMYMFTWLPIGAALTEDPPWVGNWRVRQALLSTCTRGARAARSARGLEALSEWLTQLGAALSRAWPASGDGTPDWNALVGKSG
jgi:hypothetical protein